MNKEKFKEMKERGDKLLEDIRKLPGYEKQSAIFDIEYAAAKKRYLAKKSRKIRYFDMN